MLRKGPSRSFAQKPPLPAILPPLKKKNTLPDDTHHKSSTTSRPSNFIIRRKAPSFIDSCTTRKPTETVEALQTKRKRTSKSPGVFANLPNDTSICQKQTFQNRAFRKQDINIEQNISICRIQLQQLVVDQSHHNNLHNNLNKQQRENLNSQHIFQKIDTAKSIIKKSSKKRKIQQCKTRKINWGSKNGVFDLAISIIEQNKNEEVNAPIQSLQQLYAQIF